MRFFKKTIQLSLCLVAAIAVAIYVWLGFTAVSAQDLPPLRNGDIVFQSSGGSQGLAVLAASHSAYTHMGIVQVDAANNTFVVEAIGPVQTVPLRDWIKRGIGGRITIKRVQGLQTDAAAKIISAAHAYDGRPYDVFFLPGKNEIYCSELVSLAFKEGADITLGRTQKVKELAVDNFAVQKILEERWRKYPLCQPSKNFSFESCLAIILEQELVTPASIAADAKLATVFSNFGPMAN
jgi:Permuted papain-like amidase enzyme, YaeF/YiiX, C92 family